jgi:hypothetical protein
LSEDASKELNKANRATNLKLVRTIKVLRHLSVKHAQVKTPTRISKVRLRELLAIERGKKSTQIQGILAHGSTKYVVEGDNRDSYNELSPESKHKNKSLMLNLRP